MFYGKNINSIKNNVCCDVLFAIAMYCLHPLVVDLLFNCHLDVEVHVLRMIYLVG